MISVGKGRTAALMAGPNPKKRKFNLISSEQNEERKDGESDAQKLEILKLKQTIASYQAQIALLGVKAKPSNDEDTVSLGDSKK